jgi:hypothetical protein
MPRLLAIVCVVLTASAAAAQEAVTVDLGMDAALAGEQTSLSVVLSTATEGPEVRALHVEVAVPTRLVSFVKLAKGSAAEKSQADAKAEVVASTTPDESILKIDVSAPASIRQGPLASLTFQVAKDAPGDSKVTLKVSKVTARSAAGDDLKAGAVDGTVTVLSENSPVFACFFYMH